MQKRRGMLNIVLNIVLGFLKLDNEWNAQLTDGFLTRYFCASELTSRRFILSNYLSYLSIYHFDHTVYSAPN